MELKHITWESTKDKKRVCALIRWFKVADLVEAQKILNKATFPVAALSHLIRSAEDGEWPKFHILRNERNSGGLSAWEIRHSSANKDDVSGRYTDRLFNAELRNIVTGKFEGLTARLTEPDTARPLLTMFVKSNLVAWDGNVLASWFKLQARSNVDGKMYALWGHGKGGKYRMFEIYEDGNLGAQENIGAFDIVKNFTIIARHQAGAEQHILPKNVISTIKSRLATAHEERYRIATAANAEKMAAKVAAEAANKK